MQYLSGYLREQQERYAEALPLYRKAVSLDADYLNAWKHLNDLRNHIALGIADRDAITLNLLRLDPQQRHVRPELTEVRDLRGLWNAVAQAAEFRAPRVDNLYQLSASKAALEKRKASEHDTDERRRILQASYGERAREAAQQPPSRAVARQRAVAAVSAIMERAAAVH